MPTKSKRNTVLRNPIERARAMLLTPKQAAGLFLSLHIQASSSISTKTPMEIAAAPMTRVEERAHTNTNRKRASFLAISTPCLPPSSPNNRSNRSNNANHPNSAPIDLQQQI